MNTRVPTGIWLALAVLAGMAMPAQARANGALAGRMGDSVGAALASILVGLACIAAVCLALPAGRAGAARILPALREGRFPRWYVLAGAVGGLFVLSQSLTVATLGVAVFTVAAVAGQTLTGLLVDRLGMGPGGRRRITVLRTAAALLTLAAVAWAVSPGFDAEAGWSLLLPVLLPLTAGMLISFQQAMNGTSSLHYGTPLAATLVNLVVGTTVLLLAWLVKAVAVGTGGPLPGEWYLYIGGPLGVIYVGMAAVLVRPLGVLLTGLAMIAGQLTGSLLLDLFLPAPGSTVVAATVLGTGLTLVAIVVATLPWNTPGLKRAGAGAGSGHGQRR